MRLQVTLTKETSALLDRLMEGTYMSKSAFLVHLMAEEAKRRNEKKTPGRPKKGEDDADELPDENEPRTLSLPEEFKPFVLLKDRNKKVNAYDIEMLKEKVKHHQATDAG